jgi:NitT/TauT family transport system ATP-binding protein
MTRERLNEEVLRLFLLGGFSGVFITHSIPEACYLSTRVLVMSARPGRLIAEFAVPFGYPRSPGLRFDPAFSELCGQVSAALRDAHA